LETLVDEWDEEGNDVQPFPPEEELTGQLELMINDILNNLHVFYVVSDLFLNLDNHISYFEVTYLKVLFPNINNVQH
jgi:hypothetical protein